MIEDTELLHRYADEHSETAFAELVRRHVNFVYACALRRVGGDAHLAEDVTQQVFNALASNAGMLANRVGLSGWLYTTARNVAAQLVRGERRRRAREQEASMMNDVIFSSGNEAEWQRLRPLLDHAMDPLTEADRQAVLLRFYEGRSYADLGGRLQLTENAARMRVERALERMRTLLARNGVTSTSIALGLALGNEAGVAAPAGLAASVTGAVLAGTATNSAGWLTTMMTFSKLQVGIASLLAFAGVTGVVVQRQSNAQLRGEIARLQGQSKAIAELRTDNRRLASTAAEIETLRRDDLEFKRLEQNAAELTKTREEKERLARIRENERAAHVHDDEQTVKDELDRLNLEGNALVLEFKKLTEKAHDPSLTVEGKAEAEANAREKSAAIQAKQREVSAFKAKVRDAGLSVPGAGQWAHRSAEDEVRARRSSRPQNEDSASGVPR